MKSLRLAFVVCFAMLLSIPVVAQKPDNTNRRTAVAEKEVRQFFVDYASDLTNHRRDAIAERYDRRGAYIMGNGQKTLRTFVELQTRYREKWKGPKSFEWKDLSFEILSPTAAVVLGRFVWQAADGKTFNYSYTGLVTKRNGQWRIRVEDESTAQ